MEARSPPLQEDSLPAELPGKPHQETPVWSLSQESAGEGMGYPLQYFGASLVAQLVVKNLPAMWETLVQSLGWEDPLEKGKATHSSILA